MSIELEIVTQEPQTLFGLWAGANDKTMAKDIPALAKEYHAALGKASGDVLPFYVLSKDYDPATGSCHLFIGGQVQGDALESFTLPGGLYATLVVRPRLGLLWGPAIGQAKQAFYGRWLPQSGYTARNLEYELHTEQSIGKKPSITLHFAIEGP